MITMLDDTVGDLPAIDLAILDATAQLLTRRDRKYLLEPRQLTEVLADLPSDAAALEIGGRRSFRYESTYFDTPDFVSYRMAATGRPRRFKVRVRRYVDDDLAMLEMKTRSRRGDTVKTRLTLDPDHDPSRLDERARAWIAGFPEAAPHAGSLGAVVTTSYSRSTVVFPGLGDRVTIDTDLRCHDPYGRRCDTGDLVILESKSSGAPSVLDRVLWDHGIRPSRMSKFGFGLASLNPSLASNRWSRAFRHPACRRSFGGPSIHDEL